MKPDHRLEPILELRCASASSTIMLASVFAMSLPGTNTSCVSVLDEAL
jgi:hypothetical protein